MIALLTPRWLGFRRVAPPSVSGLAGRRRLSGFAGRAKLANAGRASKGSRAAPSSTPHRAYLLGLIEGAPDTTISERLDRLLAERGMKASGALLWTFLDRLGLTFKKRPPLRANRIARM